MATALSYGLPHSSVDSVTSCKKSALIAG